MKNEKNVKTKVIGPEGWQEPMVLENEGLTAFLGQRVLLMGLKFFYEGILVSVNGTLAKLQDAGIVYETGRWDAKVYKDLQKVHADLYVNMEAVESFCLSK
jgi:hypothetical protein